MDLEKEKVRIFYESHNASLNQVAKHFGLPATKIYRWAEAEGWKKGGLTSGLDEKKVEQVVVDNMNQVVTTAKDNIKNELLNRALASMHDERLDPVLDSMLDNAAQNIILKSMSRSMIDAQMAECAALAKACLVKNIQTKGIGNEKVIFMADKVQGMYERLKNNMYDKSKVLDVGAESKDMQTKSTEELLKEYENDNSM